MSHYYRSSYPIEDHRRHILVAQIVWSLLGTGHNLRCHCLKRYGTTSETRRFTERSKIAVSKNVTYSGGYGCSRGVHATRSPRNGGGAEEKKAGQVDRSATRRDNIWPDLLQPYDITLRGSEGESASDYDRQRSYQSRVEESSARRGCFHRIRGLMYWVELNGKNS